MTCKLRCNSEPLKNECLSGFRKTNNAEARAEEQFVVIKVIMASISYALSTCSNFRSSYLFYSDNAMSSISTPIYLSLGI